MALSHTTWRNTAIWRPAFVVLALVAAFALSAAAGEQSQSPLAPADALKSLHVEPGLAVELVACEPEVIDPIAIRFDEQGRLWVVEMRDYPQGGKPGEPPLSKIRVLTDRDGDGRYETSQIFAEGLLFPTGLQPWKQGVIVTLSGEVAYLKDTNGDGRADVHEVWYRGFVAENPQLRANHPRLGLDARVYIANGLRGGTIVDPRRADAKPLSISGRDFCFDPLGGESEAVSGNGQFGSTFDDFGNRFVCNNRVPLDQIVLENRYLARNPFLAVPSVLANVAAAGEQSRVYPLVKAWTTSNLHAGQFTAACGIEIYRGDLLGDAYRGNAFICEPTGSLVHREVLSEHGVSFVSKPSREGQEFLASDDPWFRPVNLETGPDGALYVVDMYRAVIEHPDFVPSELQHRPDQRWGDDRGRIYRIAPSGVKPDRSAPRLAQATTAELVELLRRKNAWWRETAARLLLERQDLAAKKPLEKLAATAPEPTARIHALWALNALGGLSAQSIQTPLSDQHPRVREQAIVLSESFLPDSAELQSQVIALASDRDARVRFRAALALGGLPSERVIAPLAAIALVQPDDIWARQAVAAALGEHAAPVLAAILQSDALRTVELDAPELLLVGELATIIGSRREESELGEVLGLIVAADASARSLALESALLGLAQGLERRGGSLEDAVAKLPERAAEIRDSLKALFSRAADDALDHTLAENLRTRKIDLLRHALRPRADDVLLRIVLQDTLQTLQVRAAEALAGHAEPETAAALIEGFSAQSPVVRRAVLDALLSPSNVAGQLLDALESGKIARAELDATRENRLRSHADATVRARAQKMLVVAIPEDRKKVLAEYQTALELASDPRVGKELFRKHCSTCHHIGDVGVDVAPDISDSRVKTQEQLLNDILHPNQAIDNNYVSYTVVTTDGNVHVGLVAAETAGSITLRQPENKTLTLLRADIETLRSNGVSLMPEGFEKHLSLQQMADLISFVKNWRYLEQAIPGTLGPGGK